VWNHLLANEDDPEKRIAELERRLADAKVEEARQASNFGPLPPQSGVAQGSQPYPGVAQAYPGVAQQPQVYPGVGQGPQQFPATALGGQHAWGRVEGLAGSISAAVGRQAK
jgi:hypothetical protein